MGRNDQPGRRSYHHGDLRASLLENVIDVARESGVDGVTMRTVAARSGVSESAAYHHFANKADLLGAAAARAFGEFTDALGRGVGERVADGGDPAIGLAEGYVGFALGDPGAYQLIFGRHVADTAIDTRDDVREAGGASIQVALDAIGRSLANRGSEASPEEVFPMVRAVLHGVVSLVAENELEQNMPTNHAVQLATRAIDAMLNGLD